MALLSVIGLVTFALRDSPLLSPPRDFKGESFALVNAAGSGDLKLGSDRVLAVCVVQTLLEVRSAATELFPASEREKYGNGCSADPVACCKVDFDTRPVFLIKGLDGIECRNTRAFPRKKDGKVPWFVCRPPQEIRMLLDDIHDFVTGK